MSELHTNPVPLTQAYADYIAAARSLPLPERAIEVATLGFTDAIGVTLAGAQEEAVLALLRWVREQGGPPVARVLGHEGRVPPAVAAMLNATAAHALDMTTSLFPITPVRYWCQPSWLRLTAGWLTGPCCCAPTP